MKPTLDQMQALGLGRHAVAWRELAERNNANELSRDEWLGLMLDREVANGPTSASGTGSPQARLRFPEACIEDIDFAAPRGRDPILWQTGATSEHSLQRRVHTFGDYIDLERLRSRVVEHNVAGKMDKEIDATLNAGGFVAARGHAFKGENVWLLRTRWGIPTVKINGTSVNPYRWPDGTYSVQGRPPPWSHTPNRLRLPRPRLDRGTPAYEGAAVANRTLGQPDQHAASADRTYQAIKEEGIMKTSLTLLSPTPFSTGSFNYKQASVRLQRSRWR
ncbi:hypothetical protein [Mesorhizobium caraganae]|uniref:hypothetical protein n=1 Tax=Mesorhizobium caraganae TaxID=483206 RepID=UPI00333DAFD0